MEGRGMGLFLIREAIGRVGHYLIKIFGSHFSICKYYGKCWNTMDLKMES